jgi:hypothetical protein
LGMIEVADGEVRECEKVYYITMSTGELISGIVVKFGSPKTLIKFIGSYVDYTMPEETVKERVYKDKRRALMELKLRR